MTADVGIGQSSLQMLVRLHCQSCRQNTYGILGCVDIRREHTTAANTVSQWPRSYLACGRAFLRREKTSAARLTCRKPRKAGDLVARARLTRRLLLRGGEAASRAKLRRCEARLKSERAPCNS